MVLFLYTTSMIDIKLHHPKLIISAIAITLTLIVYLTLLFHPFKILL
jgi:hypothetical protein